MIKLKSNYNGNKIVKDMIYPMISMYEVNGIINVNLSVGEKLLQVECNSVWDFNRKFSIVEE